MRRAITFDDVLNYFDARAVYDSSAATIARALHVIAERGDSGKFIQAVNVRLRARELSTSLAQSGCEEIDQTVLGYATHSACRTMVRILYSASSVRILTSEKACLFSGLDAADRGLML